MPYITKPASPLTRQLSIEDMLFGDPKPGYFFKNETNTVTRWFDEVPEKFKNKYNALSLIGVLQAFNTVYADLRNADRTKQYRSYKIPKHSGGFRTISEPIEPLKEAQKEFVKILKRSFGALYHTAAFAYVEGRTPYMSIVKHQQNESQWFAAFDFHDFFGSTTVDFMMSSMSMIFPFSMVLEYDAGKEEMRKALDLCFLNGGLPQGAPSSPFLTNLMMIPIDMEFCHKLHLNAFGRTGDRQDEEIRYVYTRYADDILISSRAAFDYKKLEKDMAMILKQHGASFQFNSKKTTYGNRSGSNFHLGVCLNAQNNITLGWKNMDKLRHNINEYLYSRMRGIAWDYTSLANLHGTINYYNDVDHAWMQKTLAKYGTKYGVDVVPLLRIDMKHARR